MKKPVIRTAIDALLAIQHGIKLQCRYTDKEMEDFDIDEVHRFYDFMECDVSGLETMGELLSDVFSNFRDTYPTPETAHLLEPQECDIGADEYGDVYIFVESKWVLQKWASRAQYDVHIIQRNNQPFPKWEYEDV